jgi:PKD repeat protein
MFVEIDGVKRTSISNEDCVGNYDTVNGGTSNGGSFCDSTFNFCDPTVVANCGNSCTSSTDPTCFGRIHSEIDHDWKAAQYCGASTTCDDAALGSQTTTSTLIDFQGFIFWDPGNLNQAWHSFSGWEIHPLTGWRVHQSNPALSASFGFSPSSPSAGQTITFTASASGGTSPYTFSWAFGDGSTGVGSTTTHAYATAASYIVALTVKDSGSTQQTATSQQTVTVTNSAPPLTASFTFNPSSPQTNQQVTFTGSAGGGTTPYAFSWTFGDGSTSVGSTVTHAYPSVGTFTVVLTVKDSGSPQQTATSQQSITVTNQPPPLTASFTFSPSSPGVGQQVTFTGSASGGRAPYAFSWNFGDGNSATGSPATHVYSATGSYTVTLTTTDSANHTAIVSKNVVLSTFDFRLAANPSLLTVQLGQNTQSQIAVTSVGVFQGTVSFTVSVSSPGLTVSMEHPSVTLSVGQTQNDNLKVSAGKTAQTGVYIVTVTGKSGLLVHTLNVTARVPDFTMTANPVTLNISPGSTGSSQVLFQGLNGFQGGISTTISVSPAGPTASLNPNNPSLTPNGTKTSVLTIQVPSNLAAGVYNVTIKATSGSLLHLLVVQVHIGQHTSSTVVSCSPSSVIVNQASTCTATVTDTSTISPITPTGTVTFADTGTAGSFSSTTCILSSGSCSVKFTPTVTGNALVTGTYGGDSSHSGSTSLAVNITANPRTTSIVVACSGPVVVNQASSCTATVSDTSFGATIIPSGSVSFTETGAAGSFNSTACTLVSGSCSVTFTATAKGTATITSAYSGDSAHNTSASTGANVAVNQRTTSTAITCTSPVVVNQASNCTATITDSSIGGKVTPTGNVSFVSDSPGTFSVTSCPVAAVSLGVAGCSISYTPSAAGNHFIAGSYGGDPIHLGGNGTSTVTVGQRSTGTAVSCVPTALGVDQACTATVTDNSPGAVATPVGSVSFTTNSTGTFTSSSCTLAGTGTSRVASCQVTYTPAAVGEHTITGSYSGDSIHLVSQGSTSIGFGKDSTSTTVACSPSSVAINQATTCTVTVNDTATIGPTSPTGTVGFTSNGAGTFAGSPCTLVSQTATSSTCQITYTATSGAGTHSITATYDGDATHNGSTSSQAFGLTVTLRTTSTSVSCSPSGVVVNQATNCTAIVADSSGSGAVTPTGNVFFTPGGSCTLVNGSCSVTVTPSSSGSFSISASYGGDSNHSTSSGNVTIAVGNRSTMTSVSCSPSPVTNNTVTRCVATVTDTDIGAAIAPSGSVGFASNSTGVFVQPSCTLAATGTIGVGSCSVNYTPSVTGFHAITASYAGDSSHLGSNGSVTVTVVSAAPKPTDALVISTDGKVSRLYQNGTLTLIGQPVTSALRSVAWKPDGSYALISGDLAVLLKYDGTSLTTVSTGISTGYNFWTVSWKPDGSYALVGGSAGMLFKYDGVKVTIIPNTSATIFAIGWNPSGSIALLVGRSGLTLTYDGTTVRSFAGGTTFDLDTAAWNPNGAYALIGGLNRTLLQFNGTAVASINTSIVPLGNAIRAIAFNAAGSLALLAGDNGMVLTYDGSTLTMLSTGTSSWLYSISWLSSGTAYIVGNGGTVLTYSNGTLTKLSTTPTSTSNFRGIAWKPQ